MAIVYRHRRSDNNEPFYIGISNNKKRAYSVNSRNNHWKSIIKKHGYTVEILISNISWDDACELEVMLIDEYGRRDKGTGILVNMTDGGEGTINISEEARNKIRNSRLGSKPSEETIEKLRIASTGKKHSKETLLKMSIAQKGKVMSEESKQKISKANTGKKRTEEVKKMISKNSSKHSHSGEVKKYLSNIQKHKVKVNQYDMDGNFIKTFDSISEASRETGGSRGHITKVCKGLIRYCKGFKYKYK